LVPAVVGLLTVAAAQERQVPIPAGPPIPARSGRDLSPPIRELAQFHRRLTELSAGRIARLTILQIGDSHTEADHFSGRLRMRFQGRLGDAGRGLLAPGAPVAYWRPYQVRTQQTQGWQVITSNKTDHAPLPFGLSGFVVRGSSHADVMTLEVREGSAPFASVEIGYYRKPDGGTIEVTVDGKPVGEIDTRGDVYAMARRTFLLSGPGRSLELRPRANGSVDIADWAVYGSARGVVLTNLGFSGAQVSIIDRWNWNAVASQLRELDPALILLAFGTNEGYAPKSRLASYAELLEKRVRAFQIAAPNASIVIVSGPDANRIPSYCKGSPAQNDQKACTPLSPEEVQGYDGMLARSDPALCRWHTPGSYDLVRNAQREVARKVGAYFWDWLEVQGGMCGAYGWEKAGLVHKDRVHMKREGYWRSADRLYATLMRGFPEP